MKQQARAIQARWAAEEATEEALRDHFETLDLEKALNLLAKMRGNLTMAGQILDRRINEPNIQRCKVCEKTLEQIARERGVHVRGWRMDRPHRHPEDNNITIVDHFCSDNCISLYNNKTQGVRGISDRGMLPQHNPKNHPGVVID